MEPVLSICILTYNRERTLRETLDSILPQVQGMSEVDVLVSDNASTDGTPQLVQGYMARYPNLRYHRNAANLKVDGNIVACVKNARGEYISFFSDDDIALPGNYAAILREIAARRPAIICLNHYQFFGADPLRNGGYGFPLRDLVFDSGREFYRYTTLGFISVLTARTDYAREFVPLVKYGRGNAHLDILARVALAKPGPFVFMGSQSVAARVPEKADWDSIASIFIAFPTFLRELEVEHRLAPEDVEFILKPLVQNMLWRHMINKKCLGDYGELRAQRSKLRELYSWNRRYRFYDPVIFGVPRWLMRPPYLVARKVARLRRHTA